MKTQTKVQHGCDVKIYSDKGSLALRFPLRHNAFWEALDGKSLKGKPKCLGIGKFGFSADEPGDWKRASQIAIAMESDLDHPEWDKLFDRTLAKYGLGGGKYAKLADVLQLPGTVPALPEITVGEMWEAYLEWKKTTIEETTFKESFGGTYTNVVRGRVWCKKTRQYIYSASNLSDCRLDDDGIVEKLATVKIARKQNLFASFNEAFIFCKSRGMLVNPTTENPFLADKFNTPAITTQQKYASKIVNGVEIEWHDVVDERIAELDRRAFTKVERDIIVKAFYESDKTSVRYLAPLIEFYFLTGCRTSEGFALSWSDVDFTRGVICFSKSLGQSTRKLKETKTGEARLFYFSEKSRLKELLLKLKSESTGSLIFSNNKGKHLYRETVNTHWSGRKDKKTLADGTEKTYYTVGVVTQLVEQGAIGGYLSPYHTRHTYITLTAHANSANNNALLHIATSCGNSVDVILRHYLGVNESVELVEV